MNPPPSSDHSIYSREQTSPDGVWLVNYDYMDGERSPLIVSPRVVEIASGREIIDLWRSGLDGTVRNFHGTGFKLTIQDPFHPTSVVTTINTANDTFTIEGRADAARPLDQLCPVVRHIFDEARRQWLAQ